MSERIDLSADTWIEDGCLFTTQQYITAMWPKNKIEIAPGSNFIHLIDAGPVYEYVEGEPGMKIGTYKPQMYLMVIGTQNTMAGYMFHRRAAIVCDTAEQFRALHTALMEVSDE